VAVTAPDQQRLGRGGRPPGYTDPAAGSRRGVHQGVTQVSPPQIEPPQTNADQQPSSNPIGDAVKAAHRRWGPKEHDEQPTGRNDSFNWGQSEGRIGKDVPSGMAEAEDLADDAEVL
jgi:hypothetical protein